MKYLVGTMIEIPRAALTADEIAKQADFFSFGTNDLTQMTFGFSRDDAGKFLDAYYDKKIYENDPSPSWTRPAWASWWIWPARWAAPPTPSCIWRVRRARRRPLQCGVLPPDGPGLCVLLSLPGAHRPAGCGTGCHQGREVIFSLIKTGPPKEGRSGFFVSMHESLRCGMKGRRTPAT